MSKVFDYLGKATILFFDIIKYTFKRPFSFENLKTQLVRIGYDSLPVTTFTAVFTGMILALQIGHAIEIKLKGASQYLGGIVGLSMVKELGPMLTSIMITGRVGSAMAAEIGTMKVTEQIDALITLSANPVQYLAVPRFLAAIIMLPLLTLITDVLGIAGGALVSYLQLDQSFLDFIDKTAFFVSMSAVFQGVFKSFIFGMLIALIACLQGFITTGGAEGVGKSTTSAVVITCMSILCADYFITFAFTILRWN